MSEDKWEDFAFLQDKQLNIELVSACKYGELDIVKFILTDKNLKDRIDIHANYDFAFRLACEYKRFDIVEFLIFDFNIEKTKDICDFLNEKNIEKAEECFMIREQNETLKEGMPVAKSKQRLKV